MVHLMLLTVVLATFECSTASSDNSAPGPVPQDCMHCICVVESGCNITPCPLDSQSCGPYRINSEYWQNARARGDELDGGWRICSASFECSERAVQGYMDRFAIKSRLGHDPTCEDFARIHHGGPNGFQNSNTIEYWNQVNTCLETEQ